MSKKNKVEKANDVVTDNEFAAVIIQSVGLREESFCEHILPSIVDFINTTFEIAFLYVSQMHRAGHLEGDIVISDVLLHDDVVEFTFNCTKLSKGGEREFIALPQKLSMDEITVAELGSSIDGPFIVTILLQSLFVGALEMYSALQENAGTEAESSDMKIAREYCESLIEQAEVYSSRLSGH